METWPGYGLAVLLFLPMVVDRQRPAIEVSQRRPARPTGGTAMRIGRLTAGSGETTTPVPQRTAVVGRIVKPFAGNIQRDAPAGKQRERRN